MHSMCGSVKDEKETSSDCGCMDRKALLSEIYIVLALISILCFAGIYGKGKGTSPWDVFSMLHAGNFKLGGYLVGLVLLVPDPCGNVF